MTPVDRKPPVSPDVTAFLSPADPGEPEEDLVPEAEEPYVPYVPQLPVRQPQFPGRRKLSEDIEKYQPAEFGSGIADAVSGASPETQGADAENVTSRSDAGQHDRSRQREGGRGRERPREGNRRERNDERSPRQEPFRPSAQSEPRERGRPENPANATDRQGGGSPGGPSGVRKARERRGGPRSPETDAPVQDGDQNRYRDAEPSVSKIPAVPGPADEFGSGLESVGDDFVARNEAENTEGTASVNANRRRRRRR